MPSLRGVAAILGLVVATHGAFAAEAPAATAPRTAPNPTEGAPELARLLAQVDEAWAGRDAPGRMDEIRGLLDKARAVAPQDYGALWRTARYWYWLADDPAIADEEKARLGKLAWEWGDKANLANPEGVEGWFYGSAGVGMYSVGISIVKALFDGMESKYLDRLRKAQAADPMFYLDGADVSWGRYYYELPWPKYDAAKSEAHLRKAIQAFPRNLRARVYLAELCFKEERPAEGKDLIERVLAAMPGGYDPPEERRALGLARALQAKYR